MQEPAAAGDPFGALGDPNRRTIVAMLARGPRSVREIADEMPISRPAVSRHLRLLHEAGLVSVESKGTRRLYQLDDLGAEAVRAFLEQVWGEAAARFTLVAENTQPEAADDGR
jgi:DNA-binding transcriptional ArsR family regulator